MKKKILITGAYGFLGRELAVKLKKNSIVYGIGNSSKICPLIIKTLLEN